MSLLVVLKVFKIFVLFNGDVLRKNSFFLSRELFLVSNLVEETSLVFLCGEGEVHLFEFKTLNGEEFLDCADLSLALVTVSSQLNLADFEGDCSLILVGLPGPMVIYVFVVGSSIPSKSLSLDPEQLLAVLLGRGL